MADITILPKTKQELQEEWLKCALDFEYFAETYLKVEDKKRGGWFPFKLMPHQKDVFELYENNELAITNKYRQSGITTFTCAYYTWKMCFNKNIRIAVIGSNLEHAKTELLKRISDNIEGLPDFLRIETIIDSQKYKTYKNGGEIIAKAAQGNALRGTSPNHIILDELAHYEDLDSFWESSKSAFSMGGCVRIISTPLGSSNIFFQLFDLAKQGKSSFKPIELKWYHDIRLNTDLKWVSGSDEIIEYNKDKQKELILKGYKPTSTWYEKECAGFNYDKKKIAQELEGEFLGSGNSFIDEEYINQQELENVSKPMYYEHSDKNFWIWKYPLNTEQKFIFGVDVSLGTAEDYSTITVMDMFNLEMYAEYRGKIPPDLLADVVYKFANIFNHAYVCVDITGGYGVATVQKLINEYSYKNLHYTEIKDRYIKDRLEGEANGDLRPGLTIGKNRMEILECMAKAFRSGELIIRSSRLIDELKGFKDVGGKPDHKRGGTSDLIFSLAIALYVGDNSGTTILKALERTKSMVSSWVVVNYNNEDFAREQIKFEENLKNNENNNKNPSLFYFN